MERSNMRRWPWAVGALAVLGLALFFFLRPAATEDADASASRQSAEGNVPPAESPEDLGARGNADAGSTPTLARVPTEEDGVLEVELLANGQPVPGASARLYWRGPRDPSLDQPSWRLASTGTTDAKGLVRLASRPGNYLVSVHVQGRAPLVRDVMRPHGEARTRLRLTLEPPQVLVGSTVVKGTNEPLPLVELVLTPHGGQEEPWRLAEAPAEERVYASSNERGMFRVEGLAPGGYLLEARAPGHVRKVMSNLQVPTSEPLTVALALAGLIEGFVVDAQGRPASGAQVLVSGHEPEETTTGEGGGFSVEVEPGSYHVSARRGEESGSLPTPLTVSAGRTVKDVRVRLGPGAVLEGRVVAKASGMPVAEAHVDVSPYGDSGDSGRAVTDDTGHFSVKPLAPGSYDLVVSAPGYSPSSRRGLTVGVGEHFSLDVTLSGTAAVEGVVRDGEGHPVAGARVTKNERWNGPSDSAPIEARTDATGHYRLEGLDTGRQVLTARREDSESGPSSSVNLTEGVTARVDFTLEATGVLEGVVRTPHGPPPANTSLVVTCAPQGRSRMFPDDMIDREVDASGNFRMTLPAGLYRVTVNSLGSFSFSASAFKVVRVEAGQTVRTELNWEDDTASKSVVQGVVLEPDGTPSPRASVTLSESERGIQRMGGTDEEGHFSLSLPSTPYRPAPSLVQVRAHNGGRTGEVQDARPGEPVVVKLRPPASLRGRVVRTGGAPVRGFTVSLQGEPSSFDNTWEFPGDRFELPNVPTGEFVVVVKTADGSGGKAPVSTSAGAVSDVEITLESLARVLGRVVESETRAPVAEALIFIDQGQAQPLYARTEADGRFSLDSVPPGTYAVRIMSSQLMANEQRSVSLADGQVLDLGDIPLKPPPTPPGFLGMMVTQGDGQVFINRVSPGGPAALAGLQEGDILVSMDGTFVTSSSDVLPRLYGKPGTPVVLQVKHAGTERTVSVTRASGPAPAQP